MLVMCVIFASNVKVLMQTLNPVGVYTFDTAVRSMNVKSGSWCVALLDIHAIGDEPFETHHSKHQTAVVKVPAMVTAKYNDIALLDQLQRPLQPPLPRNEASVPFPHAELLFIRPH